MLWLTPTCPIISDPIREKGSLSCMSVSWDSETMVALVQYWRKSFEFAIVGLNSEFSMSLKVWKTIFVIVI